MLAADGLIVSPAVTLTAYQAMYTAAHLAEDTYKFIRRRASHRQLRENVLSRRPRDVRSGSAQTPPNPITVEFCLPHSAELKLGTLRVSVVCSLDMPISSSSRTCNCVTTPAHDWSPNYVLLFPATRNPKGLRPCCGSSGEADLWAVSMGVFYCSVRRVLRLFLQYLDFLASTWPENALDQTPLRGLSIVLRVVMCNLALASNT